MKTAPDLRQEPSIQMIAASEPGQLPSRILTALPSQNQMNPLNHSLGVIP
jgi:hypothetical protein